MKRFLIVGCLMVLLAGCGPMAPVKPKPGQGGPETRDQSSVEKNTTIGDVEFAVHFNGTLDDRSKAPNITENTLMNPRKYVDLTTITVKPPYPESLWITFTSSSTKSFRDTPAALRATVYIDDTAVDSFTVIMGADASRQKETYSLDVLQKAGSVPKTALVRVQAEALLLPEGTDPATVDPATMTVSADRKGTVMSNPVRINFVAEGAS